MLKRKLRVEEKNIEVDALVYYYNDLGNSIIHQYQKFAVIKNTPQVLTCYSDFYKYINNDWADTYTTNKLDNDTPLEAISKELGVEVEYRVCNREDLVKENKKRWKIVKNTYKNRLVKYTDEKLMKHIEDALGLTKDTDDILGNFAKTKNVCLFGYRGVGKLNYLLDYIYSNGYTPHYIDGSILGMNDYFSQEKLLKWPYQDLLLNSTIAKLFGKKQIGVHDVVILDNVDFTPAFRHLLKELHSHGMKICILSDYKELLSVAYLPYYPGILIPVAAPTYRMFHNQLKKLTNKTDTEILSLYYQIGEIPEVLELYLKTGSELQARELSDKLVGNMLLDSYLFGTAHRDTKCYGKVLEALERIFDITVKHHKYPLKTYQLISSTKDRLDSIIERMWRLGVCNYTPGVNHSEVQWRKSDGYKMVFKSVFMLNFIESIFEMSEEDKGWVRELRKHTLVTHELSTNYMYDSAWGQIITNGYEYYIDKDNEYFIDFMHETSLQTGYFVTHIYTKETEEYLYNILKGYFSEHKYRGCLVVEDGVGEQEFERLKEKFRGLTLLKTSELHKFSEDMDLTGGEAHGKLV